VEQVLASVSRPTQPTITNAVSIGDGAIELEFTPSTTTNTLFPVTGYAAACVGAFADQRESPASALLDNTPVSRTLTVSGYGAVSVLSDIKIDVDITHSDPSDLYISLTTPEGTVIVLWNQGAAGAENLVGTFPTTLTPVDAVGNIAAETMDGDWVLMIEDRHVGPLVREGVLNAWGVSITERLANTSANSPITVNEATRGRDYACTVAPVTGLGTAPVSESVTVNVPFELPATPIITATDYDDRTIHLTVSVADNGGTDITAYSASCTDGTTAVTGTSSTPRIKVTGLTNETAYTCTVSATNAVGTSGTSAATESITPEALSRGLPVWLLYEASKNKQAE
jgi:subtilisin-like proprotein convertase family protein